MGHSRRRGHCICRKICDDVLGCFQDLRGGWWLKAGRLATDVHVSLDPGWVGTEQVRSVVLKEEDGKTIMVLRPVQPLLNPVSK